nr:GNAT family N-acetyltransferase [Clostridia bacterium]
MIHSETERLILRDFEESDLDGVYEYCSSFEHLIYLPWGPLDYEQTKAKFQKVFEAYKSDDEKGRPHTAFAVALKDTGEFIGRCFILTSGSEKGELGWILINRYQGRGYGTELGNALLKFGFEKLGLHRIIAHCDADNIPSWKVMEKLGMRREGHYLETRPANKLLQGKQKYSDEYEYAMLDREWFERKK